MFSSASAPDLWSLFDPDLLPTDGDLGPFARACVEGAAEWFGADRVSLFIQGDDGYAPIASVGAIIPGDVRLIPGVGIAGQAIHVGRPLLVDDPAQHPALEGATISSSIGFASSMIIPLQVREACVGVLNIARRTGRDPFGGRDLTQASALAGRIALAVQNAHLFAAVRQQARQALDSAEEQGRLRRLAEIGQMTAAIAHEIRNPLTGIRGAAQMMEEEGIACEWASIIGEEVEKLNRLCDDFLEYARPLEVRLHEEPLNAMAERVVKMLQAPFAAAHVELVVEYGEDAWKVRADRMRVEQVLRNLILNALQASSPDSRVEVQVRPHRYRVLDQGCGMNPEQLANLFTPFFTTKAKGTGLGLATAAKIIEAHGGTMTVVSEVGQGTTFDIEFPSIS